MEDDAAMMVQKCGRKARGEKAAESVFSLL
jgi:hypothetical protein